MSRRPRFSLLSLATALLCLLGACAPTASAGANDYRAAPDAVIAAVAQFGPRLRPGGAFTPFRVESRGDGFITLRATETMGSQMLSALSSSGAATVQITVSAVALTPGVSRVVFSVSPAGSAAATATADRIVSELGSRFGRADALGN